MLILSLELTKLTPFENHKTTTFGKAASGARCKVVSKLHVYGSRSTRFLYFLKIMDALGLNRRVSDTHGYLEP